MKTDSSYDARLYKISKKIHDARNDGDTLNSTQTIHNGLFRFYKQLSGELDYDKSNVFPYMPVIDLTTASDDNLEKLCTFYLDYMRNEKPGQPPNQKPGPNVRKVKSNLTKINLLADTELADQAMLLAEKYCNVNIEHDPNNIDKYNRHYAYYQQTVREYIKVCSKLYLAILNQRKDKNTFKKYFIFTYLAFRKILKSTELDELGKFFNIWQPHYRAFLHIDISLWIILQGVTNCIIGNKEVSCSMEYLNEISKKVENLKKNKTIKSVTCSENIFMTYSEFLLYPSFGSKLMEDILVLKQLQTSCTDNEPPQKQYSFFTDLGTIKELKDDEKCQFFLEGDIKGQRAFDKNYEKCIEFIKLYNKSTNRELEDDDITLKAIYRELILEKTKRNKRQSITIFNEFIKNGKFQSKSEYYFVNEKINFGMYRERDAIKEFFAKNELQEELYELSTLLLTRLDPTEIFQESQQDYSEIFSLLETLIPGTDDSISYQEIERSFLIISSRLSDIINIPLIRKEIFSLIGVQISEKDDFISYKEYKEFLSLMSLPLPEENNSILYEDYEKMWFLMGFAICEENDSAKRDGIITYEEIDDCLPIIWSKLDNIKNNPLVHANFIPPPI